MKAAGITAANKDPVGGKIERGCERQSDRPAGRCGDGSGGHRRFRRPRRRQWLRRSRRRRNMLLAAGITATADMGTSAADWAAMNQRGTAGRLNVRIMGYSMGLGPMPAISADRPSSWLYADRLRLGGVKFYADGALGSRGAWLKQPYADQPDTRGLRFLTRRGIRSQADQAASDGPPGRRSTRSATPPMRRSFPPSRSLSRKYGKRSPLAHRAFPDRRPGRHSAPRAGRHHRVDAADAPDQRPADGGEAARTGSARRAPMPGSRSSSRARGSPSDPTFRWNRPIPSRASRLRSAART